MSNHKHYTASIDDNGELNYSDAFQDWLNSRPIPVSRHDLDAIPPDTFDDGSLGPIVNEVSRSLETPIELAGFLGLGALGTVAAKRFSMSLEPGYFEPLNIWVAAAMEPSNRKSAALKLMAGPIKEWEANQRTVHKPLIDSARSERKTSEKLMEDRRKKLSKFADDDERKNEIAEIARMEAELPVVPVCPQLTIDDCTPERVATILSVQGERIAYLDSEADALFAMMQGKYSDKPALDVYLKGWSGDPVSVDRQTRDPVHLNHPLLTIGIAPQPALIQDLVKKPILVKRGLLSRFLFSVPESKVGYRSLKPMSVSEFAKLRYENALKCLLKIPANLNSNGSECLTLSS